MTTLRLLAPEDRDTQLEVLLPVHDSELRPLPCGDSTSIQFLHAFSRRLLGAPDALQHPETVALAYWLRRANVERMFDDFRRTFGPGEWPQPRGMALHITPSNVDTIFVYSWALSLLAGNLNIVRVSQADSGTMPLLLAALRDLLQDPAWSAIRERNAFVTYARDEVINRHLSQRADVRVIWGGDETVMTFRALPGKPTTKDVVFADKASFAVMDAARVVAAGETDIRDLAKRFRNDAYWFDQMACSSPRLVYFAGHTADCKRASERFWKAVDQALVETPYNESAAVAVGKLAFLQEKAARGLVARVTHLPRGGHPAVALVERQHAPECRDTCGGGTFFECFIPDLSAMLPLIRPSDQTMTHWGFDHDRLAEFVQSLAGRGLNRIVPTGSALAFQPVWDGYRLLQELTQIVTVTLQNDAPSPAPAS